MAKTVRNLLSGGIIVFKRGSGDPLRILIADDDPVIQKTMAKLLKKIGFQADVVDNGLEAVHALQKQSYDVVFMDVQMPQMDGLQAARAIRDLCPYRCIRIIAVTGCTRKGDKEMCLQAGMDDYIPKPARYEDVLASLSE